jgi:hypothetical protein
MLMPAHPQKLAKLDSYFGGFWRAPGQADRERSLLLIERQISLLVRAGIVVERAVLSFGVFRKWQDSK